MFERCFALRSDVFKALEESRAAKVIGKPLEAHVVIDCSKEDKELLEKACAGKIAQWLIVSKVTFAENTDFSSYEHCKVKVLKADGTVCPRCWNVSKEHNEEGLCPRCQAVLN